MKIIEQTDSVLVLQSNKLITIIFGIILLILLGYIILRLGDFFQKEGFLLTRFFWLPFIFSLGALYMIFFSVTTTMTFDKAAGAVLVTRRGIIINNEKNYLIENIEKVKLQEFWGTSTLVLGMKDGTHVFIYSNRSGVFWGGEKFHGFGLWNLANSLSTFLNLPLKYKYPGMDHSDPENKNYPEVFFRK